jgi:hypothetical protein
MPNQLALLPPNATFADVKQQLAALPTQMPIQDLRDAIPLEERIESILVGPAGCGKTTLIQQHGLSNHTPTPASLTDTKYIGVFDDNATLTDTEVVRTIQGMLTFQRTQKQYAPKYRPLAFVSDLRWDRIKNYFNYVDPSLIGTIGFPKAAYVRALHQYIDPAFHRYFGDLWLEILSDARGRITPKLAWDATLAIREQTVASWAKPHALALATFEWITREPTFKPFVKHMSFIVPQDTKLTLQGRKLQISRERATKRLYSATRVAPLPHMYSTKTAWLRAAEVAGIWKLRPQGWYLFGRPYSAGYSLLKERLLNNLLDMSHQL